MHGYGVDDKTILERIHELVEEEKNLRASHRGLSSADLQRLSALERQLDQSWDLLRQRRARADNGDDPDDARERSIDEVESYLQ